MNRSIVKIQFGSFVYGTNVPTSDHDYKGVFIPDAQDLVMQRAAKHIKSSTKKDDSKRNGADDVDDEQFSIQTFMELIRQGQTVALDMLFTPKRFYVELPSSEWDYIHASREQFLHKGTNAFVGYTKAQAAKYGHKGERVAGLREVVALLRSLDPHRSLEEYSKELYSFAHSIGSREVEILNIPTPSGQGEMKDMPHISVANKKVGWSCTVQYALQVYKLALDKYGHRALLAEKNEGIDWKATMHAVRIAAEAKELLLTRYITFPRPEASLLLQIRKGELPYKQVEELIEQGLKDITDAEKVSTLPDKPNFKLMEEIVSDGHWGAIRAL